jgi:hypothetical protein
MRSWNIEFMPLHGIDLLRLLREQCEKNKTKEVDGVMSSDTYV